MSSEKNRILIIDDNASIHDDFRKVLVIDQKEGNLSKLKESLFGIKETTSVETLPLFEIDSAFQGEEGLEKIKKAKAEGHPYALAFVDVRMPPGWDGIETISHIWQVDDEIQTVICTAFSDYSWEEIIHNLGHSNRLLILKKPFDNIEIRQMACSLTEKWKLNRKLKHQLINLETLVQKRTSELQQSFSLVKATLESTMDGIVAMDNFGKMVDCNQNFLSMWNITLKKTEQAPHVLDLITPKIEDSREFQTKINKILSSLETENFLEIKSKEGKTFECYCLPQKIQNEIVGRVWSFHDITARKEVELALRLRERAIEASTDGIIIFDTHEKSYPILYANPAFEKITGYNFSETIGKNFIFYQKKDDQEDLSIIHQAIENKIQAQVILKNTHKNGSSYWYEFHIAPVKDVEDKFFYFVGILIDVTHTKLIEEQLAHRASHDFLTELPNRFLLIDRLQHAIKYAKRNSLIVPVFFIDLDQFKIINDTLGHQFGDIVLKNTAQRLLHCVRESDTVARIGGDEFVIVLTPQGKEDDFISVVEKILQAFKKPFKLMDEDYILSISIGISIFPKDGEEPYILLKKADIALYQVKEKGKNSYKIYE